MNRSRRIRRNKERGIAMLVALLAMVLLAIIGLGFMYMASTENSANNDYKDAQKAYFASRAGLENVRSMLAFGSPFELAVVGMPMPQTTVLNGAYYVENTNGGAVDPTAGNTLDTELCKEQFPGLQPLPPGPQGAPCTQTPVNYFTPIVNPGDILGAGGGTAMAFPWVRITNKQNYMALVNQMVDGSNPAVATPAQMATQVCWDGVSQYPIPAGFPPGTKCTDPGVTSPGTGGQMNPVWLLTSLAVTPGAGSRPGSRRMTQMEVAISPPLYVLPNGAVSAKAPITIKGNLVIDSYDNCTCTPTGGDLPGAPTGSCDKSKWDIYSASQISQNGQATTLTSGQNPPTYPDAPWTYNIPKLIDALSNGVQPYTTNCTGVTDPYAVPSVNANCGTISGPAFGDTPLTIDPTTYQTGQGPATTFIPGSVQLDGNASGSGILIVDGDLNVHGGLNFYGLIIVLGQISFTGGGSQDVNLYGALLAGQDVNAQDIADGDTIGGSFSFHYDSCALKLPAKQIPGPPALLAEHEAMY